MSLSRAQLEAMDRDELVEKVEGMEHRLSKLQEVVYETFKPRLDTLEAENDQLRDRVDRLEGEVEAIRDLGSERTSKEEKIAQVVIYAENETDSADGKTTVLPKTVKGIVGVSRRYAYDLIDDMVDDYEWARDPQEVPRRPDQDTPQKGVLIDLERLHDDEESVNKFTTGIHGNGGDS